MSTLDMLAVRTEYHRFNPPRRPTEYLRQPGPHFGLALPPSVLDAIAEQKVHGGPDQYVVQGEWRRSDGVNFLDLAVNEAYIVANTYYRPDEHGRLRWVCPDCGKRGGQHTKVCEFE